MGLINEIIAGKKEMAINEPLTDEGGQLYYPDQPQGTRQANRTDLENGFFKKKTPFLLYGPYYKRYYCERIKSNVPDILAKYISEGLVFIWLYG